MMGVAMVVLYRGRLGQLVVVVLRSAPMLQKNKLNLKAVML